MSTATVGLRDPTFTSGDEKSTTAGAGNPSKAQCLPTWPCHLAPSETAWTHPGTMRARRAATMWTMECQVLSGNILQCFRSGRHTRKAARHACVLQRAAGFQDNHGAEIIQLLNGAGVPTAESIRGGRRTDGRNSRKEGRKEGRSHCVSLRLYVGQELNNRDKNVTSISCRLNAVHL